MLKFLYLLIKKVIMPFIIKLPFMSILRSLINNPFTINISLLYIHLLKLLTKNIIYKNLINYHS